MFRLDDNRVVILSSNICQSAKKAIVGGTYRESDYARAMQQRRKVDVTSYCVGISRDRDRSMPYYANYDGYLFDNADKPSQRTEFRFGDDSGPAAQFRMVSAIAEAADIWPRDDLHKIAPEILKIGSR